MNLINTVLLLVNSIVCEERSPQPTAIMYGDIAYRTGIEAPKSKPDNLPYALSIGGNTFYPDLTAPILASNNNILLKSPNLKKSKRPGDLYFSNNVEKSRLETERRRNSFQKRALERQREMVQIERKRINEQRRLLDIRRQAIKRNELLLQNERNENINKINSINEKTIESKKQMWSELFFDLLCAIFFGFTSGVTFFVIGLLLEQRKDKITGEIDEAEISKIISPINYKIDEKSKMLNEKDIDSDVRAGIEVLI